MRKRFPARLAAWIMALLLALPFAGGAGPAPTAQDPADVQAPPAEPAKDDAAEKAAPPAEPAKDAKE